MKLSYCVVNTEGRDHLIAGLDAIAGTHPAEVEAEVLVLDNASGDGSAAEARAWAARSGELGAATRVIERDRRVGKSENDSLLLREARGEFCLLLNEDAELRPGAASALLAALEGDARAAVAGALLLDPGGTPLHCAWRLPGWLTVLGGVFFVHKMLTTESGGGETREVGWVQSSAMLVRRQAAVEVDFLDPAFFVYSDETDFCKRLHDAGWSILHVPAAQAVHHEQLATDARASERRIVEFHRGRDLYMRKHHSALLARLARPLGAWTYLPRTLAALVLPGHDPRRYWLHARKAVRPWSSPGMREAAEVHNRRLAASRG